MAQYLQWQLNT